MRVGVKDDSHGTAIGCEYRFSGVAPQRAGNNRVADAHESIDLQQPKPKVEKDSRPILGSQRLGIGADFGQFNPAIHAAELARQAQRDTMAPRFRSRRF